LTAWPHLGREVDQVVRHNDLIARTGRRSGGERLRGRGLLDGTSDCGTDRSSIGQSGWPVSRSTKRDELKGAQ
jgi:hypothetical protein